jgi:DNA-binding beta-propeller fold protein YncE
VQQTVTWALPAEGPLVPAPRGVLAADGELFVLDNVGRVLVYDEQGKLLRHWWMPEYSVGKPEKLCLFRDGRLAVADTHYSRVVFFDREGNELGRLGSYGRGSGQFIYPVAIAEDDAGYYYVCEYGQNDRIQKFTREGTFVTAFGSFGTDPGQFQRPSGIVWREGKIFVADAFNDRIQVFSDKGEFLEVLGAAESSGSLHYPYDIAAGPKGDFYVVEYSGGRVTRLDGRGRVVGRYGTTGQSDGQFLTPVDSQGRVFVADTGNRRIVKLDL